ncbi:MAG: aminoglycoside phosphotransferase family protein [Hyphomicrobiales bacterium]|nr:aminoglycoside phosphotransferase family protein [Hyphomicrobiales bacterium]
MTPSDAQLLEAASDLVRRTLGGGVTDAAAIRAGGNNRIVRVARRGEPPVVVKVYFRHAADQRDRLATEYGALSFLWQHGLRVTPRPLASDPSQGMAIYSFLDGAAIPSDAIGWDEIAAAVGLLDALHALRGADGADRLSPASEAFFTREALIGNLHDRWQRHAAIVDAPGVRADYRAFRDGPLRAALEAIEQSVRGAAPQLELAPDEHILSPSDFGFHNALRTPEGAIVFLDFEYFGWDDPAKTVCDFCYHPAMQLSPVLRASFTARAVDRLGGDRLRRRIQSLFPIFGLKWCFILLNEFLPEGRLRRMLASGRSGSADDLMALQLAKAKAMLDRVGNERERDGFAGVTS